MKCKHNYVKLVKKEWSLIFYDRTEKLVCTKCGHIIE